MRIKYEKDLVLTLKTFVAISYANLFDREKQKIDFITYFFRRQQFSQKTTVVLTNTRTTVHVHVVLRNTTKNLSIDKKYKNLIFLFISF